MALHDHRMNSVSSLIQDELDLPELLLERMLAPSRPVLKNQAGLVSMGPCAPNFRNRLKYLKVKYRRSHVRGSAAGSRDS